MKIAAIRYYIIPIFILSIIYASGIEKGSGRRNYNPDQTNSVIKNQDIKSVFNMNEEIQQFRKKALLQKDQMFRTKVTKPAGIPGSQNRKQNPSENLKTAFHRSSQWQDFGRVMTVSETRRLAKTSAVAPELYINGQSALSVDAGELLTITATLSDSALVEIFFDANGDSVIDTGDLNLFDVRFPFDDDMPQGELFIYDNDWEDEDPTVGSLQLTIYEFPYVGIPVIMRITDAGGSATAYLDIGELTGHLSVSGNVISGSDDRVMVFITGEFDEGMFMTFTDETGAFDFGIDYMGGDFMIGAVDAYLTVETGQFLAKITVPWGFWTDYASSDYVDIEIDITRDASVNGTVNNPSGDGLAGANIGAGGSGMMEAVIAFTSSDSTGSFSLPLQSGFEYMIGSMHPDYMDGGCLDIPFIPAPGDTINVSCILEPWPAFVQGTVTDINTGDPLADIEIELHVWNHDSTNHGDSTGYEGDNGGGGFFFDEDYWRYTWTDDDGYYRIGTRMGTGWLCAYDWDWVRYQVYCLEEFVVDQPLVTEDITMTPWDGLIHGTVTDSLSGEPIPDAYVYLSYEESNDSTYFSPFHWTETNEDGSYRIPVMNGDYRICAGFWDMGYKEVCDSVTVNFDTVTVNLKVQPPDGLIYGYVTDAETGDSLPGISIEFYSYELGHRQITTDENGYYQLGVDNGTWEACFHAFWHSYEVNCVYGIVISDDSVEVNVALVPITFDGAVTGTVLNDASEPVHAIIVGIDSTGDTDQLTMTKPDGSYFLPLDNGMYMIGAFPMDPMLIPAFDAVVINYDTVTLNFIIDELVADAVIYGVVKDSLGNALEGAQVIAGNSESNGNDYGPFTGYMAFDESDAEGNYALEVIGGSDFYYWIGAQYFNEDSTGFIYTYIPEVHVMSGDSVRIDLVLTYGEGGHHDGEYAVSNSHGNFRFNWGTHGRIMNGEWPYGSGTNYLADGALAVMAVAGPMHSDTIFAGLGSADTTDEWNQMGGWTNTMGVAEDTEDDAIYRGMGFQHGMGHGLEVEEMILYPDTSDFVVVMSRIRNKGNSPLSNVTAGYGMDWDVTYSETHDTYDDDLSGSKTFQVSHPILPVLIPVKISWMMDNDGDNGASPGIAAHAMIVQPGVSVKHRNIDLSVWEPSSHADMTELMLGTSSDDADATAPSDYAVAQFASFGDLGPGESIEFATVMLVVDDTTEFTAVIADVMSILASELLALDEPTENVPVVFSLEQNYPNPFNPVTRIQYTLPQADHVNLSIYNILGQEVIRLVDQHQAAGVRNIMWNGRNRNGDPVSGGIYFYRLSAGDNIQTRKMVFLK